MQGYGHTLITADGSKMLIAVDGAKGKITYTKAALYTQDIKGMSEDEQRALTSIDDEQMSTPVVVTNINDNTVTVSASFNNAKLTKDITFNSIGWFAKTSVDDQERLLAVTPSDAEQTIVAGSSGASTSALDINMAFARSDNATVVIKPTETGLISQTQLDAAINQVKINLEAEFPDVVKDAVSQINNNIKGLTALNSDSGNNIYNTKINLDTFSTLGISKFLGCQLQSDGKMVSFDSTQGNLYGWIFDIPKWDGAKIYEQIVYIIDYGQGSLTYVRTKADPTSKEDFIKVANDRDLNKLGQIKQISVNGGTAVSPNDKGIANIVVPEPDLSDYETKADAANLANEIKKRPLTVNSIAPDSKGNINLSIPDLSKLQTNVNNALNRITALENRETFHYSKSIADGQAYSANNPQVLVGSK